MQELTGGFAGVPFPVVLFRLMAALVVGGVIGWERHVHSKPAGMRTHMMIALASCLFTLVTFDLVLTNSLPAETVKLDPLRLTAAITSGVAFLAAGTIITSGGHVHGLTTGAAMWLTGALGLACGAGFVPLAALCVLIALIVLWVLRRLETDPPDKPSTS